MPRHNVMDSFKECEDILKESNISCVIIKHCNHDSIISIEKIQELLNSITYRAKIEEVDELFSERKYQDIANRLLPIFLLDNGLPKTNLLNDNLSISQKIQLLQQLSDSCIELQHKESLNVTSLALFETILNIIKSEDFERSLKMVFNF